MNNNTNQKQSKQQQSQETLALIRQQQAQGRAGGPRMGGRGMGFAQKPKDFKGTFVRLIKYMGPQAFIMGIVIVLSIVSTILWVIGPAINGLATTNMYLIAENKSDINRVIHFLTIAGILYIASTIVSYVAGFIVAGIAQRICFRMRKDLKQKLDKVPLSYFDKTSYGETLSRITNDVDTISGTLQQALIQAITSVVQVIGVVIAMFILEWRLALIVIASVPVSIFATAFIAKKSQKYFRANAMLSGQINAHIEEMYSAHTVVKAFSYEKQSKEKFDNVNNQLAVAGRKAQFLGGIIMPLMRFISNITYIIVAVVSGLMLLRKRILPGLIQSFVQYIRTLQQPIAQFAQIINVIQSTVASAERVFEIMDEKEEVESENAVHNIEFVNTVKGNVAFENVCFSYDKGLGIRDKGLVSKPAGQANIASPDTTNSQSSVINGKSDILAPNPKTLTPNYVLNNLSFNADSGKTIAIVGPTGAGKTTIVNLLMRFYEINQGKITLDGTDITYLTRDALRQCFGMVLQDTWLFNGTIRDNIAYGRQDATLDEIIEASKKAQAHHFIEQMVDGYNTILNEDATNISQGQKQLLTIARVFLANPPITILDEATSSVDTRTEVNIKQALKTLAEGKTSFVIAHRLSTIRTADTILVVDLGDIVEQGSHAQLLALNGYYSNLYNSQFNQEAE